MVSFYFICKQHIILLIYICNNIFIDSTTLRDENKAFVARHLGARFTPELESMFDMRTDSWRVFCQLVFFVVFISCSLRVFYAQMEITESIVKEHAKDCVADVQGSFVSPLVDSAIRAFSTINLTVEVRFSVQSIQIPMAGDEVNTYAAAISAALVLGSQDFRHAMNGLREKKVDFSPDHFGQFSKEYPHIKMCFELITPILNKRVSDYTRS